jgi:hypothetical protein
MEWTATRSGQRLSDVCFVVSLSNALFTSYLSRNPTSERTRQRTSPCQLGINSGAAVRLNSGTVEFG